jgi:hypothetical protein
MFRTKTTTPRKAWWFRAHEEPFWLPWALIVLDEHAFGLPSAEGSIHGVL